jgi:hypothetical protein
LAFDGVDRSIVCEWAARRVPVSSPTKFPRPLPRQGQRRQKGSGGKGRSGKGSGGKIRGGKGHGSKGRGKGV